MMPAFALIVAMTQSGAGGAALSNQPPSLPITTIDQGTLSGIDQQREMSVRTPAQWEALWRQHAPERERPAVDFDRFTVLAVFMGARPTAGWSIRIVSVVAAGEGGVEIVAARSAPQKDHLVAQIVTTPFHIVTVPRFSGPATFRAR
jgi:hypothetical protein